MVDRVSLHSPEDEHLRLSCWDYRPESWYVFARFFYRIPLDEPTVHNNV